MEGSVNGHLADAEEGERGASHERSADGSTAASALQATSQLRRRRDASRSIGGALDG